MQKKISVIIPIYNGEKYIGRCLNSVLDQAGFDIGDLEILLLNDGSSDGSSKVLKMYEKNYSKVIRLVDKKNQGVAKTRDMGIRLAIGKYILFIDQDDYIDSDYCKTFYETAENGGYDVVVGGYRRPNDRGKIIRVVRQKNTEYSKKYKISAAWAKIHRTDFLRQNRIKFYDNNYGEDIIFTINEVNRTDKIFGINYIGYNWFWNSESVSNTRQRGLKDDIRILKLLQDMTLYSKNELDEYYMFQTGIHYGAHQGRTLINYTIKYSTSLKRMA